MGDLRKIVYSDCEFDSREAVYEFLSEQISNDFNSEIFKLFLEREYIGNIKIFEQTILPHFEFEKLKNSSIFILRLKNSIIEWSDSLKNIKLIICIALKKEESLETKKKIVNIVESLSNDEKIKNLLQCDLKEELV